MFLKRLSIALCALTCFSGFVLGTNLETKPDAKTYGEENVLLAPLALGAQITPNDISCYDEGDGSIDVIVSDFVPPYYYELRDLSGNPIPGKSNTLIPNTFKITGLQSGFYRVYIKDHSGSEWISSTQVITEPSQVTVDLIRIEPIQCNGLFGEMEFTATSDVGGFTYYARNTDLPQDYTPTNNIFTGIPKGNYTVWAIDANGCTGYYTGPTALRIDEPSDLDNVNVVPSQITCFNELGNASVTGLPENTGINAYNISLRNNRTGSTSYSLTSNNTYTNLDYGTYTLTVSRNGCTPVTRPFEIFRFDEIEITHNVIGSILCYGEKVEINVAIAGGKSGQSATIHLISNDGDDANDFYSPLVVYGNSHTFNNISEGSYTIRVVDNANPDCIVPPSSFNISGPANPLVYTANPIGIDASCFGEADGTIQFSVSGGALPYKYEIGGNIYNNTNEIALAASNYTVRVVDNNDCKTTPFSVLVDQPDPVSANLVPGSKTDVTCPEGRDGSFAIKIAGGNGTYSYDLVGPVTRTDAFASDSLVVSNLPVGSYDLIIRDGNGCSIPLNGIVVDGPAPLSISSLEYDNLVCPGSTTEIAVSVSGGNVSSYTYQLIKAGITVSELTGTSAIFPDVTPSRYTVRVIGNPACTVLDTTFNITSSQQIGLVGFSDSIMVSCADSDGELHIQASGAYPFTYILDGTGTPQSMGGSRGATADITGLSASLTGSAHTITIIDVNGCSKDYDFTVYAPEPLENTEPIITNVSCYGNRDGRVEVSVSGGSPNYMATMGTRTEAANTDGLIVFENVAPSATAYFLTITDSKGCMINDIEVTVEQPDDYFFVEEPVVQTPVKCFGEKGEIILSTSGGWPTANQTIRVRGEGIDTTINNNSSLWLKQGTYTASAINEDNCMAGKQFLVSGPTQVKLQASSSNVTCNGADNAKITINASGGNGNYSYGLGGSGSAGTPFSGNQKLVEGGISIGEYNVIVQDDLGCESNIVPITITEPEPITFDYVVDSVSCYGGNNGIIRILNARGGSGTGYRSNYSTGGAYTAGTLTISGLAANTYSVYITDNSGICSSEPIDIVVSDPDEIIFKPAEFEIDHILCYNENIGRIRLSAQGGAPYGLQYRITRGTNYDSGYSSNFEFTGLQAGIYTAWVRNSKGNCEQQFPETLIINNATELVVNAPVVSDVLCHNQSNGTATIVASGGTGTLTYTLTNTNPLVRNNDGIFTNLGEQNKPSTTYSYMVEDINQCKKEGSFTIRNPEQILLSVSGKTEILCNDDMNGTMTVMVTGGTVTATNGYSLSDYDNLSINYTIDRISANQFKITGLGNTGTVAFYNPVATDNNGCQTDALAAPVEFINPDKVVIDSVSLGEKLCHGDTNDQTIIYASGGTGNYYYSLNNGTTLSILNDNIFVGEVPGTKYPYVVDENGCANTAPSYEYEQPDPLEVDYEFFPIMCYNDQYGDMKLEISGGTGNYELSINSANFTTDVTTIDRSPSNVTNFGLFENDIFLRDNLTYEFFLRDANGCHVQNVEGVNSYTKPFAETIFSIPEKLVLVGLEQRSVNCRNENTGIIIFEAKGGTLTSDHGYLLTAHNVERNQSKTNVHGSSQVDKLFPGLHRCYLTDANGCVGETKLTPMGYDFDTISVAYANESIFLEISSIVPPTCDITFDGSVKINVADYGQDGVTAYVDLLNPALNIHNPFDENDTIHADPDYTRVINEDNILYFANSVLVADHMGIGRYVITVEDNYTGCTASIDTLIESRDGDDCPELNNYNAFTPHNGDQLNENFVIYGSQYQKYTLQVYTSYGELVYADDGVADSEGVKWNGVDNSGRPVPVGTYIYLLKKDISATQDTIIINNITILRGDGRR